MTRAARLLSAFVALLLMTAADPAVAQAPPDERWFSFDTEHFRIHYTGGLEPIARRAAPRAERAYRLLSAEFLAPPRGRIDLLVADNVDFANGVASPFPRNRVIVFAHPPSDETSLAFFDDWLELVIVHELAHVFHLDHAAGLWLGLRSVFGRSPLLFPHVLQPPWLLEGLATYFESRMTGAGRVRGTLHEMALRTAVLEGRFFALDRVTGDPLTWPGATTRYVYGSMFVDFLAREFGPDRTARLVEGLGGRLIPYRLEAAARAAYGVSFSQAWGMWRDSLTARYAALADTLRAQGLSEPEILVDEGGHAAFPRYSAFGELAYVADPRWEQPTLRVIGDDGRARTLARLATVGPIAWTADGRSLIAAQLEFDGPYRIRSDLHRLDVFGRVERLTRAARLWDGHPHPLGGPLVAVAGAAGTNALVLVDPATGEPQPLLEPSLDVHWSLPRWSPDGSAIAVSRWRSGGFFDVVLLDTAGAPIRELTASRALDLAPAWSPDGRYVVYSSDRTGIANLYAYDLAAGRELQVTNVLTGAFQPDVSPDGRWIAFSYYGPDGYRLARVPFDPAGWRAAAPVAREVAEYDASRLAELAQAPSGGPARGYSAWPSVLPTSWWPLLTGGDALGPGYGAAAGGVDLVERHLWSADAVVYTDRTRAAASAWYRYRGFGRPIVDLAAGQTWTVRAAANTLGEPGTGEPIPAALLRRRRYVQAASSLLWPGVRASSWLTGAAIWEQRHHEWDDTAVARRVPLAEPPPDLGVLAELGYVSARRYALSIGPQDGVLVAGRAESRRELRPLREGAGTRGYTRLTTRGRAYQPTLRTGFAPHVLALRVDAGAELGSRAPGFSLGGIGGTGLPLAGLVPVGESVAFPVRGYPEGVQQGNRAAIASAEYRVPISTIERGVGVLPLYLSRLWADVFVDAGSAWCAGACEPLGLAGTPAFRPLVAVGAESVVELKVAFHAELSVRGGVALPLTLVPAADGSASRPPPRAYLRLGRAF